MGIKGFFRTWHVGILGATLLLSTDAFAQRNFPSNEFDRADVIAIEQDGREIFGFDAISGRRASVTLDLGETVFFEASRGRVGLVLTDRRALALGRNGDFREFRYDVREVPPQRGLVDDQIALVLTSKRVLGFLGARSLWVEEGLPPSEDALDARVGAAVGVVTTNRRALGVTASGSGFASVGLQINETLESVRARDTLATIRTNRRILVFGGAGATWTEQDRSLR